MKLPAWFCRVRFFRYRMCMICDRWSGPNLLCKYHKRKAGTFL